MGVESGTFQYDGENLGYTAYKSGSAFPAGLLSLHGAGPAGRERIDYLCRYLLDYDVDSFTFDFSGHGESSGLLEESSLARRTLQTRGAANFGHMERPDVLLGTSMGGYVALTVLEELNPRNLILFCPAIYGDDAYNVPFDSRFSEVIRRPASYENSRFLDALEKFEGSTLLFMGTEDRVIPRRVVEIYENARVGHTHYTVWLDGVGHVIHKWANENLSNGSLICDAVAKFLR